MPAQEIPTLAPLLCVTEDTGAGRAKLTVLARDEECIEAPPPCVAAASLCTEDHQGRCVGVGIGTGLRDDRDRGDVSLQRRTRAGSMVCEMRAPPISIQCR